jgi:KDO2-lipid IV(A) lauroyltransferase
MKRPVSALRRALYALEAAPFLAVMGLLRALPRPAAARFCAALARTVGPLLPIARHADRNLARCFPEMRAAERRRIARAMWDNLGRVFGEFMHLKSLWDPSMPARADAIGIPEIRRRHAAGQGTSVAGDRIEIVGLEHWVEMKVTPGPILLFSAHMGNFELLPMGASALGIPIAAVYRTPNNPIVAGFMERQRRPIMEMVPKGLHGAFMAARVMERGGRLGFLVDQKQNRGIPVPFFGRPAMTGTTLAKFALEFNAPIYGGYVVRTAPDRFRMVFEPRLAVPRTGNDAADIAAIMTAVNASVERWVRQHPEQWLWLHRRWPKGD